MISVNFLGRGELFGPPPFLELKMLTIKLVMTLWKEFAKLSCFGAQGTNYFGVWLQKIRVVK